MDCDPNQTASLLTNVIKVDWLDVIRSLFNEERTQYTLLSALLVERSVLFYCITYRHALIVHGQQSIYIVSLL